MRRHILLVVLAAAGLTTASAQTQGTSGQRAQPARPPSQQATPPANTTSPPANTTTPPANTTVVPPNTTTPPSNPATNPAAKNPNVQPERTPPAARGVGAANRPNCSNLKGLEKSECERRDTSRDDLPAGVTTTQPKDPPK